jgi:hypothetical protein
VIEKLLTVYHAAAMQQLVARLTSFSSKKKSPPEAGF